MLQATDTTDWNLVSNDKNGALSPTGIVHHENGCGANNGRNVLHRISPEQAAGMRHCQRCEAKLGNRAPVARQSEGTKVETRLSDDLLSRVDDYAESAGQTRAAALRTLVSIGLSHA